MAKKRKLFYGWWIVLVSAVLSIFSGGTFYYGFTVFFNPIRNTFGWTAAATSIAFVLQRLEGGLLGPVVGFLVDKVGPRKLMVPGWFVAGLGFLWMSRIDSIWGFYFAFLFIALGFSFGTFVTVNAVIANWFDKKRSRAMTLMYIGFGLSGLMVPVLALLIGQYGWRTSLLIIGIAMWLVGIPLSLVMRHRPEQYGYRPDGASVTAPDTLEAEAALPDDFSGASFTVREALRTRAFWMLSFVFFFQQVGTSAIMVHIVPFLESVQIPTSLAAMAVTGMTLCSLIGRLGFGLMGDHYNKRYLMTGALILQFIGVFLFSLVSVDKTWLVFAFLLTYGPGYGGPIPLRPSLQADYFGTRNFGTIMGLMLVVSMVGGLASPVFAGWLFDTTGSYQLAFRLLAVISLPGIPLMLLAKQPQREQGNT